LSRNIQLKENNGWVDISLDALLKTHDIDKAIDLLRQTENQWLNNINSDWFKLIRFYNKSSLLLYCNIIRNDPNFKNIEITKRLITVASIIYNFSIPRLLLVIDNETILNVLKYIILTEEFNIDIDNTLPGIDNCIINVNIKKYVTKILNNTYFRNRIDYLRVISRLPNFIELRELILMAYDETDPIHSLSELQFKKVLTCLFLQSQLSIPRDYIYLDIETIDYVNQTGQYFINERKLNVN
jgi:hypothetical protein